MTDIIMLCKTVLSSHNTEKTMTEVDSGYLVLAEDKDILINHIQVIPLFNLVCNL
jgi:hypothetical protein